MNENKSIKLMADFNKILEDYEDMFGELPPIPKCGSYSTIASAMEDAMIARKALTWNDIIEYFDDVKSDLV